MIKNYVLIDFENVQPDNLDLLKNHSFKLVIFVGSNQKKISFDIVEIIQSFGNDAEYVKIDGNGQNALDFHIAFYIGKFSALESNAYFHIISKDTGFDPLIKHLETKKIKVKRQKDISEIPIIKNIKEVEKTVNSIKKDIEIPETTNKKIELVIKHLTGRKIGGGLPSTKKTLLNSLNSLFQKKLNEKELENLINEILKKKIISIVENKVIYSLPKEK